MAKIETAIIDQHNAKPLSSADAPAGYPYKNMAIIEKIESAWGTIGWGLPSLFPLPIVPRALSFSFSPASPQHKEASVKERDTKPLVWKRYIPFINDVFSLLDTDKEEINTCIYKGARFEKEYILDTRTYFKPTETFQYTHFKSCHPHKVKKSFMKGEGLRLLRRRLSKKTLKDSKYAFNQEAIPSNLTDETLSEIKFSDRKTALKENTRVRKNLLLFVTQYNPSVPNLF